jgi:hypothetical protein
MPYGLVSRYNFFRAVAGDSMFLQNALMHVQVYTL